ncbi:hypothetical protein H4S08_004135 [Coemansia sp. RSA 1365]|nr:hypothetical protein H4S08_004135 [Coemansia sp. RSA 1365]
MNMLIALEEINAKFDLHLLPPSSYLGSTETSDTGLPSMVPHCAPEGSTNTQQPHSMACMHWVALLCSYCLQQPTRLWAMHLLHE